MNVEPRLVADVKSAEGCRLVAYKDSLGNWTIGYGHLLDQHIDWTGHEITQATADAMLASDLGDRATQLLGLPESATLGFGARRNAVIECIFNLGLEHWRDEFTATRAAIVREQWASASANLLHSPTWIKQVGLKRVARLADYLAAGSY